jgi:hypothetical protein
MESNPLSGIEAVERELLQEAEGCLDCANPEDPFTKAVAGLLIRNAARLKAEREKIQKLLDPDPRIEVVEPYDFRLYAAMEQIRLLNRENERLEPFLKAAMAYCATQPDFKGTEHYGRMFDAYRAMRAAAKEGT